MEAKLKREMERMMSMKSHSQKTHLKTINNQKDPNGYDSDSDVTKMGQIIQQPEAEEVVDGIDFENKELPPDESVKNQDE